jgi:hydrogenase-1 operon protein HyaE
VSHPLIQRLFDDYGYPEVTLQSHDAFINQPGITILFFAGEPKTYRETTDVAVVLPELAKAFQGGLIPGIVAAEAERALQQHYGFAAWPALVFLRNGGYLGTITGIQNWTEYLQEIGELVKTDVKSPPGFKIPVVGA